MPLTTQTFVHHRIQIGHEQCFIPSRDTLHGVGGPKTHDLVVTPCLHHQALKVRQPEANEDKAAEPDVVQKRLKASLPITVLAKIKLIDSREGRGAKAEIKNGVQVQKHSDQGEVPKGQRLQQSVYHKIKTAKKNCGGLDAGLHVIGPVSHGVHRVVCDRP
tara:strand:+ start:201 stop:683 length:483 start_codon:yes stop_codon:yes gene_type:complete